MKLFIAIDDTDNRESIGTGRLSRMLAESLTKNGFLQAGRVTRHQLLVHPAIPYTSHNSSACIDAVVKESSLDDIADFSRSFLRNHFHEGANPGLCICRQETVPRELPIFGARAQREVIDLDEAKLLAGNLDCLIWWDGPTGQGCIGAMSAVGLRSTNNDGSYIGLDGIREIGGIKTVGEILNMTAIDRICDLDGHELPHGEMVDTQDWVRPILKKGRVVLELIRINGHWRASHQKKAKRDKNKCASPVDALK
ncbi:MAG: hypothetical protein JXA41_00825 [Deltaproteobacteria bacterium]|nr:hypothetical protein [Deltaproteobacteria bacterium]